MFCKTLFISVLQFVFDDMFHLPQQPLAAWRLPVPPLEPCAVGPDEGVQLAAADTLVVGLAPGCEPLSPPAVETLPAVLLQITAELGLAVRGVFRGSGHGFDDPPVGLERLLPGTEPPQKVVDHRHLVTEHETQTGLLEREPFKGSFRPSVFAASGGRLLDGLRMPHVLFPDFLHLVPL